MRGGQTVPGAGGQWLSRPQPCWCRHGPGYCLLSGVGDMFVEFGGDSLQVGVVEVTRKKKRQPPGVQFVVC